MKRFDCYTMMHAAARGCCACALGLGAGAVLAAAPAAYPNKPIRMVVASAPGGSTDTLARTVGNLLTEAWGQQVVHDNRPGAGGIIAAETVARSAADGYTLLWSTTAGIAVAGSLYSKLPYDPVKDFQPITLAFTQPYLLVVNPSVANSVQELINIAKAKPGFLSFGSTGVGVSSHLTGEFFKSLAGIDLLHVPYKSMSANLLDVVSGRISMSFSSPTAALPQTRAGKLKALAVTSAKRSPVAPELPTMEEAGVKGYALENWYGLLAPARTPGPVVKGIHGVVIQGMARPQMKDGLMKQGASVVGNTPEEFSAFIKAEIVKWARLLKQAGIQPER